MGLPQMGRTVRLVVVYYPEYRAKYSRFVKRNFMLGAWAVGIVVLSIRKWIFFGSRSVHHSRYAYATSPQGIQESRRVWRAGGVTVAHDIH